MNHEAPEPSSETRGNENVDEPYGEVVPTTDVIESAESSSNPDSLANIAGTWSAQPFDWAEDVETSLGSDPDAMANTTGTGSAKPFDGAEDVDDWLGSREETRSHFSDSSSDDGGVPRVGQLGEDSTPSDIAQPPDGNTLADPIQIADLDPVADTAESEVEGEQEPDWMRGAYKGSALLPYGGSGDEFLYRRDAKFFHQGDVNPRKRLRRDASAERLPSLLSDSGVMERYRIQRDEARREREEFKQRGYDEYVEKKRLETLAKTADEKLREAEEETGMLKHAIDTREQRIDDLKNAFSSQKKLMEGWEKAFKQQRPLADAERERQSLKKAGYEEAQSVGTQTDFTDVQSSGTQNFPSQPSSPAIQTINTETRTHTETENAAAPISNIETLSNNALLSLVLPPQVRSQVVAHAMGWVKTASTRNSELDNDTVTAERAEMLFRDERSTFKQLCLALGQDSLGFQPKCLAHELERFIRPLSNVPTAILCAARCGNNAKLADNNLLEEISQLQHNLEVLRHQQIAPVASDPSVPEIDAISVRAIYWPATIAILAVNAITFMFDAREALMFRQLGLSGLAAHIAGFSVVVVALLLLNEPRDEIRTSNGCTECNQEHGAKARKLEEENSELRHYNDLLLAGNEVLRREQDDHEDTVGAFQEQLEVADSVAEQLQKDRTELETQLIESREYGRQLRRQRDELKREYRDLEMKRFERDGLVSVLPSKASTSSNRRSTLGPQHRTGSKPQLDQSLEHSKEIKKKLDLLAQQNEDLRQRIKDLTGRPERPEDVDAESTAAQLNRSLERSARLQKQRDWLKRENKKLERKVEELNKQVKSGAHTAIELQSVIDQLEQTREHCTHLETHCDVLETERQKLRDRVTGLTEQLHQRSETNTDRDARWNSIENDNIDLHNSVNEHTNELIALRSKANSDTPPIESDKDLRKAIQLEAQNNSLTTQMYELRENVQAMQVEQEKPVRQKKNLIAENERLDGERRRLTDVLERFKEWTTNKTWIENPATETHNDNAGPDVSPVDDTDTVVTPTPFPPIPRILEQ